MMLAKRASRSLGIAESSHATFLPFLYLTKTIVRAYSDQFNLEQKAGVGEAEERRLQEIKDKWSSFSSSRKKKIPADDTNARARKPTHRDESTSERVQTAMRRPKKLESIPFEGDTGSATPAERLKNSTMTPREMQIFEELFRKGVEQRKKRKEAEATVAVAEAQAQNKTRKTPSRWNSEIQFPELLKPLAEEAHLLRQEAAAFSGNSKSEPIRMKHARGIAKLEIKDKGALAIRDLMDSAATDIELWEVLRDHILDRIPETPDQSALQAKFPALPALLYHYMRLQTDKLPSTHSLGLVVLPELKKLGPSAFALGATTELYNQHMRLLWRQYRDLDSINDTLSEMEKEVYGLDEETQALLDEILEHARNARNGRCGSGVRALWTMERKLRGVGKMGEWKRVVDERLRERALSEARANDVRFSFEDEGENEDEDEDGAELRVESSKAKRAVAA